MPRRWHLLQRCAPGRRHCHVNLAPVSKADYQTLHRLDRVIDKLRDEIYRKQLIVMN